MTQNNECGFRIFDECDGLSCARDCSARMPSPSIKLTINPVTRQDWRVVTGILFALLAVVLIVSAVGGRENWTNTQIAERAP